MATNVHTVGNWILGYELSTHGSVESKRFEKLIREFVLSEQTVLLANVMHFTARSKDQAARR
jgi:hypothetical protein